MAALQPALSWDFLHHVRASCRMRGIESGRIPSCRYSDALLSNLWRWLCSPASRLASSGLHRTVTGLLRKTLAQLVADLR